MKATLFLLAFVFSAPAKMGDLAELPLSLKSLGDDVGLILAKARLPKDFISFEFQKAQTRSLATISCSNERVKIDVIGPKKEWFSTFYYGLQKLGFLFPHPRMQISPKKEDILKKCGVKAIFSPAFRYRGFHLHTLHPSEWVHGFHMGRSEIAFDTVRWMARNSQNVMDLSLLRQDDEVIFNRLKRPFELARSLGVYTGVALGIAFQQQNSYKLVPLWRTLFDGPSLASLQNNLQKLFDGLPLSFVNLEAGTSEFTPVNYERSLKWINKAGEVAAKNSAAAFIKIHVSSNQRNAKYGNFNFLPKRADPSIGVLPHTVFFYGLYDEKAPMYGNKNFHHIRDFALEENQKRPVWHYPETSYWIGMDVGVPLFLTDYLLARSEDMRQLRKNNLDGQINFTTGQELGYWLFDWSVALFNNLDYQFDPLIGLKLLGEDTTLWQKILDYQNLHLKRNGLAAIVSFANLGDELSKEHRIHKRNLLKELNQDSKALMSEINKLKEAERDFPDVSKVKNKELRNLLTIQKLRIFHALSLRNAIKDKLVSMKRQKHLDAARRFRSKAQTLVDEIVRNHSRYPETPVFKKWQNPTSYQFGYGYSAATLRHWHRAETMVRQDNYSPWFLNLYDPLDI
ncbi:MAG: hypothetical protein WD025_04890, partial [Bacteriovoracaceae bacterium]